MEPDRDSYDWYHAEYNAPSPIGTVLKWAVYAVLVFVGVTFAWAAFAHEAPTGWSYSLACCDRADCREVDGPDEPRQHSVQIVPVDGGYRISTTGEVIREGDPRLKFSPDGRYHWCSHGGKDDAGTICIYRPPMGF